MKGSLSMGAVILIIVFLFLAGSESWEAIKKFF
ncbi:hypothetical protein MUDAN_DOGOELCO_03313 [Lactiplantibacillus mudanjiangensis]|nr:hypothetical protein MUDAN_DOGOELCO_03313 [Lactiplantibacillus mudanjiangensis]